VVDCNERALFVCDLLNGPKLPPDMIIEILGLKARYYGMHKLQKELASPGLSLGKAVVMFIFSSE